MLLPSWSEHVIEVTKCSPLISTSTMTVEMACPAPIPSYPVHPPPMQNKSSSITPMCGVSFVSPQISGGQFAFARIKGDVCLVQVLFSPSTHSPPSLIAKIFRHEFITIFRLSHALTVHPSEIRILEPIDDTGLRYEEDSETVFLAKDLVDHVRRIRAESDLRSRTLNQMRGQRQR